MKAPIKGARVAPLHRHQATTRKRVPRPPPLLTEARWIPTGDESQQRTPGVSPGVNANKYGSTINGSFYSGSGAGGFCEGVLDEARAQSSPTNKQNQCG